MESGRVAQVGGGAQMSGVVKSVGKLGFPFKTPDPFLFCVYHKVRCVVQG